MRFLIAPGIVVLQFLSSADAQSNKQPKKSEAPAILATAQSVFVEPYLGPNGERLSPPCRA